jgi:sugar phosphate isomerase/epimerase
MKDMTANNHPKLHNAMWPGLVGKGSDSQPPIDLETMLDLTANAQVDGQKFDGVDLFLCAPHIDIDSTEDDLKAISDKIVSRGLAVGSLVAPIWEPAGGGSAMGSDQERSRFLDQVRKSCGIAKQLSESGVRPYGVIRIDSACGPEQWASDPAGNQNKIADTFRQACDIAADYGEKLAVEGEICWGGIHNWKDVVNLLEMVGRDNIGFQADMAHTLLYLLGYNAPEHRILPEDFDWSDTETLANALTELTAALRPWTIDLHIAQNDATVHGSGSHDKTGRHCLVNDPNGKLDVVRDAGYWLRDENGEPTQAFKHICWDGCMFDNEVMLKQQTWNDILAVMIKVRDTHG